MGARVIEVIETDNLRRGDGTPDNPIRIITQYWTLYGELMWEHDPLKGEQPSFSGTRRRADLRVVSEPPTAG